MSAIELLGSSQSPECVARGAGLCGETVRAWIKKGRKSASGEVVKLEAMRIAGRWRVPGGALERFLAAVDAPHTPSAGPAEVR